MKKAIRIFDAILTVMCVVVFAVIVWAGKAMPTNIVLYDNSDIPHSDLFSCSVTGTRYVDSQASLPHSRQLKLLGIIPVKEVSVTSKPADEVYVSGEVFGIKLYTDGVIVVGTQTVETDNGVANPASDCGIQVGDVIVCINNTNVYTSDEVENILNDNNGKAYKIKVKRNGEYKTFFLTPVYSQREGCFKAGMWVRDSTAGIGTMTFYNKNAGTFAALGHQINDVDTNKIMPLLDGEAVSATVTDVERPSRTETGSLECNFLDNTMGRIMLNTECGIYGAYAGISDCAKKYPVAAPSDVERGDAKIICTVKNGQPCEYSVQITRISYNENHTEKNMVIKITDSELIAITGGIVQGMSGSPIIQNGKLVGALTHVIVNNSQKGYAVFAQYMVQQSEKITQ